MYYLGLDYGGTQIKAALYDQNGQECYVSALASEGPDARTARCRKGYDAALAYALPLRAKSALTVWCARGGYCRVGNFFAWQGAVFA